MTCRSSRPQGRPGSAYRGRPRPLLGARAVARATRRRAGRLRLVKVFSRGQLIKTHPRLRPGGRSHRPQGLSGRPGRIRAAGRCDADREATAAGPAVGIYASRLLDVPLPWTRMRTVYRLLGLVRSYGAETVEHRLRAGAGARRRRRQQDRPDAGASPSNATRSRRGESGPGRRSAPAGSPATPASSRPANR